MGRGGGDWNLVEDKFQEKTTIYKPDPVIGGIK